MEKDFLKKNKLEDGFGIKDVIILGYFMLVFDGKNVMFIFSFVIKIDVWQDNVVGRVGFSSFMQVIDLVFFLYDLDNIFDNFDDDEFGVVLFVLCLLKIFIVGIED